MSRRRSGSLKTWEKEILDVYECEQRRVGRELHDGLCQELAGIALLTNSMQRKLQDGGVVIACEAGELTALVRVALRRARGLARGLDPVAAEPHGLAVALQQLAVDTADVGKVDCLLHHPHPVDVDDPLTAIHLYRIAQDAVWDAVREGDAARISIELRRNPDGIELTVCDDGTDGVTRPCALRMMKHRARVIGATLKVNARTDVGCGKRVVCRLRDGTRARRNRGSHEYE
jgi:signal transduction histidine kinase